ncbi:uncharacterized protein [Oscarella lobularis]|uniref:uncharacterized protein isoform X2 n=1 Tax=Oscarella lobularis TaxID=121494 RepID=UPI003313853D
MDKRWRNRVHDNLPSIVEVFDPMSVLDRLLAERLVSREQYAMLRDSSKTNEDKSRILLVDILPRKGDTAFDEFVDVLRGTERQEHVVRLFLEPRKRKNEIDRLVDEGVRKFKGDLVRAEMTVVGLRKKIGPSMGSPSLKWETNIPNMPINCSPYGSVAEIDGMLHVGSEDRMFQFKKGAWEGEKHHLPGIYKIWSVFECEGKGYVVDMNDRSRCSSIYEWKSETKNLELLTKIPDEYQLYGRSAIGHNGNIYLVGGGWGGRDRVDCFDINKGEWEPIKKMKNERWACSLAVIDDKMFVGGGAKAGNSVECFSMEKLGWIDIKPTTKEVCQLSSWNEKLVATGGWDMGYSNCVEMYDELSGDWLPLPSMNKGRYLHGACTTKDNQLIVVGGEGALNSVECLKM